MFARFVLGRLPVILDAMAAVCRPSKKRAVSKISIPRSVELKFFDTTIPAAVVSGSGISHNTMCGMVQGTGASDRIGRLVTVTEVDVLGNVSVPGTSTQGQMWDAFRILVVVDKQPNLAVYTSTDLLVTADEKSHLNLLNELRFEVLKEHLVVVNQGTGVAATGSGEAGHWIRFVIPCNIVVEFTGNTGAVSQIRTNSINCFVITRNGVGVIEYIARLRYTDA